MPTGQTGQVPVYAETLSSATNRYGCMNDSSNMDCRLMVESFDSLV